MDNPDFCKKFIVQTVVNIREQSYSSVILASQSDSFVILASIKGKLTCHSISPAFFKYCLLLKLLYNFLGTFMPHVLLHSIHVWTFATYVAYLRLCAALSAYL